MACPGPADMTTCGRKSRCYFGSCEGVAYDSLDPCPGEGSDFDSSICECVPTWTSIRYKVQGPLTTIAYCCNSTPQGGCSGCDGSIAPGYPVIDNSVFLEEDIVISRVEWEARYSLGVDTASPCNTYENFATLASAKTWRGPGRRWISNDSLTSGCDLSAPADNTACVSRCDGNLTASLVDAAENFEYFYS